MADNLVVPQIHVERQFVIYTVYTKCGHIADDALKRLVDLQLCHEQIGINTTRISRFLVLVMFRLAFDFGELAAFVGIAVRQNKSGIQTDFGV